MRKADLPLQKISFYKLFSAVIFLSPLNWIMHMRWLAWPSCAFDRSKNTLKISLKPLGNVYRTFRRYVCSWWPFSSKAEY